MPFFDPPPPPPDEEYANMQSPRVGRYAPGVVPLSIVLAENDRVAVMLEPLLVYPDGVQIRVRTYRRKSHRFGFPPFPIGPTGISGTAHFLTASSEVAHDDEDGRAQMEAMARQMRDSMFGAELRFGAQFPDGTKATYDQPFWNPFDRSAPVPTFGLEQGGGSGDDTVFETSYFLWPVPGPGTLLLVCEWPEHGIPETAIELDTQPIIEAATRARVFWPEDEGLPSHLTSAHWGEDPD